MALVLLGADVEILVTGVGGPDEEASRRARCGWGLWTKDRLFAYWERCNGDPGEACRLTCDAALPLLLEYLQGT